ncbi:MAG: hypothetical protein COB67_10525 [SAR324 cluster bacterium]|uniref:Uncharacterized protein n=1 Tax=SAR324 cluster bacterium TaxID=2024889 RepID=A0A2A4SWY3_9DELT|nr:MAG: hypothetical protein COB67_10525 [SAR324 cluster bacterium]
MGTAEPLRHPTGIFITLWPLVDSLPELANGLMNRVHTLGTAQGRVNDLGENRGDQCCATKAAMYIIFQPSYP